MNINDFCGKDDNREYLHQPFNLGNRTIATNGHMMLSTPKYGEHKECPDKISGIITKFINELKTLSFAPIPDIKMPEKVICSSCGGSKKAVIKYCEECDGDGWVDATTEYNTYYGLDCKTCDGNGNEVIVGGDKDCPTCEGKGNVFPSIKIVDICGVKINMNFLSMIYEEKNLEVSAGKEKHVLYFRSGNNEGVIMGMRE